MVEIQKKYEKEIKDLVSASNKLAQLGYVSSHGGNLSYRVEEDVILITPTKVPKRNVNFDNVCIIRLNGEILYAGEDVKPTGESPLHINIYLKRPDINALIHAHPPVLTGFSIAHNNLLENAILPEPVLELGPVLSIKYEEPLSQKLASAIDEIIDRTNSILMRNHGVIVLSYDGIERALDLLEMLEALAQSVLVAQQLGNVEEIPTHELKNLNNVCKIRNLPIPGNPRVFSSLEELYRKQKTN